MTTASRFFFLRPFSVFLVLFSVKLNITTSGNFNVYHLELSVFCLTLSTLPQAALSSIQSNSIKLQDDKLFRKNIAKY